MGLDLVVEGCAKPGHEEEWRRILERSFAEKDVSEEETERFSEISIPGYQRIGAPRVGYDKVADAWIIESQKAKTDDEIQAVLKEFHGYYVLSLIKCDGIPEYSHGGLYEGAEETSFRGAFLKDCNDVLPKSLINEAWDHKFPEDAVRYGRALLDAADTATTNGVTSEQNAAKRGWLSRLWNGKAATSALSFNEQQQIVQSAGRWFVFWGERGHAIRAWF